MKLYSLVYSLLSILLPDHKNEDNKFCFNSTELFIAL